MTSVVNKRKIIMNKETELALKMIDILSKQNATPEEKKIQALIKTALFSDSLMSYSINNCQN